MQNAFVFLQVYGWRQFADVRIDFGPRLTIITGANGAGKTTLLHLLAPHVGWNVPFVSLPRSIRGVTAGAAQFFSNIWASLSRSDPTFIPGDCGSVGFSSGATSAIKIPVSVNAQFEASFVPKRRVAGLFIPSHRPVFVSSREPTNVPGRFSDFVQASEEYSRSIRSAWDTDLSMHESPLRLIELTLLAWNSSDHPALAQFSEVLADVFPSATGFEELYVDGPSVLLRTKSGTFTIEAVSGGIAAIIDMTWQLFLYSRREDVNGAFVALIDEPENHLHPELQRSILFKLISAFPMTQFIVASHAPLIVTSVREAAVYALAYADQIDASDADDLEGDIIRTSFPPSKQSFDYLAGQLLGKRDGPAQRVVYAVQLRDFEKSGTANHILTRVLGLDYTLPVWAANVLDQAVARVSERSFSQDALHELKATLHSNELSQYMPEALSRVVDLEGESQSRDFYLREDANRNGLDDDFEPPTEPTAS